MDARSRGLWAVRTAAACLVASLPHLLPDTESPGDASPALVAFAAGLNTIVPPGLRFFIVLITSASSMPTLGATARQAAHYSAGAVGGGVLAACLLGALGTSLGATWAALFLGSPLLLLAPSPSPSATKVGWACFITGLMIAAEDLTPASVIGGAGAVNVDGGRVSFVLPLLLTAATLIGASLALLAAAPVSTRAKRAAASAHATALHCFAASAEAVAAAMAASVLPGAGDGAVGGDARGEFDFDFGEGAAGVDAGGAEAAAEVGDGGSGPSQLRRVAQRSRANALLARATALLADAAASRAVASGLADDCLWEAYLRRRFVAPCLSLLSLCLPAAAHSLLPAPAATLPSLGAVQLAVEGLLLAAAAAREGDAQREAVAARLHAYRGLALPLAPAPTLASAPPSSPSSSSSSSSTPSSVRARGASGLGAATPHPSLRSGAGTPHSQAHAQTHAQAHGTSHAHGRVLAASAAAAAAAASPLGLEAQMLRARRRNAGLLDARLAPAAAALCRAARAGAEASAAVDTGAARALSPTHAAALLAPLHAALAGFDEAVTAGRTDAFYSGAALGAGAVAGAGARARARAAAEATLLLHGLPPGRYLFAFSLRAFGVAVAALLPQQQQKPPPPPLLLPPRPRPGPGPAADADADCDAAAAEKGGDEGDEGDGPSVAPPTPAVSLPTPMLQLRPKATDEAVPSAAFKALTLSPEAAAAAAALASSNLATVRGGAFALPPALFVAVPAPAAPAAARRAPLLARCHLCLSALLPNRDRAVYAAKLTVSAAFSVALGRAIFGSGMWAAAAVAFVGPRDGPFLGGSLHLAYLRMAGTVAGGVAGLATALACGGMAGAAPILILAAWVVIAGMARGSSRHAYGAMVAQFTPYILLEFATSGLAASWALARVLQNLLGVVVLSGVELAVAPRMVSTELRLSLARALAEASAAAEGAWRAQSPLSHAERQAAAASTAKHVAALGAQLGRQRAMLVEASEEPGWVPLSLAPSAALSVRALQAAIDCGAKLAVLLCLMEALTQGEHELEREREHEVAPQPAEAGASAEGAPVAVAVDQTAAASVVLRPSRVWADVGRLVGPCMPEIRALLDVLRRRYATLGLYVTGAGAGVVGAAVVVASSFKVASSAALDAAVRHLDARVGSVFVSLVREAGRGDGAKAADDAADAGADDDGDVEGEGASSASIVSSREMVRFVSLAWATTELAKNCETLREAIRGIEQRGAPGGGGGAGAVLRVEAAALLEADEAEN